MEIPEHEVLQNIKAIITDNPRGLNIQQISARIGMNRNSVSKYMDKLTASGHVEVRHLGPAKMFYPSQRVPLNAILSYTSELIVVLDRDRRVVQVNSPFLEFTEIPRDLCLGTRVELLDHPLMNNSAVQERIAGAIGGEETKAEIQIRHAGETSCFNVRLIPTVFEDDSHGATLMFENVTDQKRAGQALQQSEKQYRAFFENTGTATIIIAEDTKILLANSGWEDLTGISKEESAGRSWTEFVHEDDVERLKRYHYSRRKDPSLVPDTYEVKAVDAKNTVHHCIVNIGLIPGTTNSIASILDITDLKKSEQALEEREHFLANVFSGIVDGLSISDADMNIVRVNRTMEQWYSDAMPLVGRKCYEVYRDRSEPCEVCPLTTATGTNNPAREVVPKTTRGELTGWLDRFSFPLIDPKTGAMTGVIEYYRDISKRNKAEKALQESEERYRAIVNAFQGQIYISSKDFRIEFMNSRFIEKTGRDMTGEYCYKALHGRSSPCPWCFHERVFSGETVVREMQSPEDHRWYHIVNTPVSHADGSLSMQTIITDSTDTRLAEEAIRKSERRLTQIINFLPDPTFAIDCDGKVIAWNRAIEEVSGVKAKEMIGRGNYEYALPFYGERRPILIDFIFDPEDERLDEGYNVIYQEGPVLIAETAHMRPQGKEIVIWAIAAPLFDEKGNLIGAIESIRNITRLKRDAAILQEQEKRYNQITGLLPVAVFEVDIQGKFTSLNTTGLAMFGYSHDDLAAGINVLQMVRSKYRKLVLKRLSSNAESPESGWEYMALKKDGAPLPVRVRSVPILVEGRLAGHRGIIIPNGSVGKR